METEIFLWKHLSINITILAEIFITFLYSSGLTLNSLKSLVIFFTWLKQSNKIFDVFLLKYFDIFL